MSNEHSNGERMSIRQRLEDVVDLHLNRVAIVTTAVTGVLALSIYLFGCGPEVTGEEADERLEFIEAEYSQSLTTVELDWPVNVEAERADGGGGRSARPIVITLRNSTDAPAVLTAVQAQPLGVARVGPCEDQAVGGTIVPSAFYDLVFDPSRTVADPKNFKVDPQDADALSVTVGPAEQGKLYLEVFAYTLSGLSSRGREAKWVDVVGTNWHMTMQEAEVLASQHLELATTEELRSLARECATRGLQGVKSLIRSVSTSRDYVEDPSISSQIRYFEVILDGL